MAESVARAIALITAGHLWDELAIAGLMLWAYWKWRKGGEY